MFLNKFTDKNFAIKYRSKFSKEVYDKNDLKPNQNLNFVGGDIVLFNSEFIENYKFSTILGSCVSIVFNDPTSKIVGVSHYLKPVAKTSFEDNFSSGDTSSKFILEQMVKFGADINRIKAQIYGGASVNESLKILKPGKKNVLWAEEFLQSQGIRYALSSVEDKNGRIIYVGKLGLVNFELIFN